jgi:hypothetical protein
MMLRDSPATRAPGDPFVRHKESAGLTRRFLSPFLLVIDD